jgi:hypothetical protein
MEKRAAVLALALTLPLVLYGIPYAYAATTTLGYTARSDYVLGAFTANYFSATCIGGDFATGGGWLANSLHTLSSFPTLAGNVAAAGTVPDGWMVYTENPTSSATALTVFADCLAPITVAGIGVPEFGSLYVAIALGAVAYFMLSRRFARRPTVSAQVKT